MLTLGQEVPGFFTALFCHHLTLSSSHEASLFLTPLFALINSVTELTLTPLFALINSVTEPPTLIKTLAFLWIKNLLLRASAFKCFCVKGF